jgi:transposase
VSIKQIVRRIGHSRKLVRQVLRGERTDVFPTRQNTIDAYLPFLDAQWTNDCRKGAELWRRLKEQGFRGSLRVVSEWAPRRRRAQKVSNQQLQKVPSARTIARLMTVKRDHMSKADAVTVAAIQAGVPSLVEAHGLIERFHAMIRKKEGDRLDPWIAEARDSQVSSFATGIAKDKSAVRAAITEPWSNGQVEAQITKLKLVKRQMYGRANLDLLQASLLGAA